MLEIRDLSKTYPNGVKALRGIDLDINQGMFGLLGPNGSGKSTFMKILATLLEADSGTVNLNGLNFLKEKQKARRVLGYLPQEFGVYKNISAENLLSHIAILKGITPRGQRKEVVESLLVQTNLFGKKGKAVSTFSGGMRQRFGIAQALLGDPKLIIVDEPTSGLDPGERNRFYDLFSEISDRVIVILSTHIVEDVKELCNQMAIIKNGKILYHGAPKEAISRIEGNIWKKSVLKDELISYKKSPHMISFRYLGGVPIIRMHSHGSISGFESVPAELEDFYFLNINGNSL